MPTKALRPDPETLRAGRVLEALRARAGVTQEQAAAAAEPPMTSQYWGMHETGRVPGIYKPANQRKLIDALNAAGAIAAAERGEAFQPVSLDDFADGLAGDEPAPSSARRMARMARELAPPSAAADSREAIFPTRDGPVVFRYPAHLTAGGRKDLEAYFAVFLQTVAPDA